MSVDGFTDIRLDRATFRCKCRASLDVLHRQRIRLKERHNVTVSLPWAHHIKLLHRGITRIDDCIASFVTLRQLLLLKTLRLALAKNLIQLGKDFFEIYEDQIKSG